MFTFSASFVRIWASFYSNIWSHWLTTSVTSKKSPNVYKNCPKMISLVKFNILTPLQKCRRFGQINCCQRLWKFAQSPINCPIWSHSSPHYLKRNLGKNKTPIEFQCVARVACWEENWRICEKEEIKTKRLATQRDGLKRQKHCTKFWCWQVRHFWRKGQETFFYVFKPRRLINIKQIGIPLGSPRNVLGRPRSNDTHDKLPT